MPPRNLDKQGENWSVGCEHECADWNAKFKLWDGFKRSPDYTIVNSNGIAAQPNPKLYQSGGEINTPPSAGIYGQIKFLEMILDLRPAVSVNHRSNLHCHIRVPGLKDNLKLLKQVQLYIHEQMPKYLNLIEPIPVGQTLAEKKREKRRRVSHHTLLTKQRLEHQLAAKTVKEFFEREVPATRTGKPMWHAQPRLAVGLRQILQTDTVEFRHWPGTLQTTELSACFNWCCAFMKAAVIGTELPAEKLMEGLPKFPDFNEELEIGYQATASHNGLKQSEIKNNIRLILEGKFDGSEAKRIATARARGLPW